VVPVAPDSNMIVDFVDVCLVYFELFFVGLVEISQAHCLLVNTDFLRLHSQNQIVVSFT